MIIGGGLADHVIYSKIKNPNMIDIAKLVFIILIIGLFSCEKDLPFPEQDVMPNLVLNGLFTTDSTWTIQASKSAPVNSSAKPELISNALIRVLDDQSALIATLTHQENGNYQAKGQFPIAGRTYTVEAEAPGLNAVKANSYLPQMPEFKLTDTLRSKYLDIPVLFMDLEIDDNPDETNYYLIEVTKTVDILETEESYTFVPFHYVFDQNAENDEIDPENSGFTNVLLPDETFNGKRYTVRFAVELDEISDEERENVQVRWTIRLFAASEALYKYNKSLERYYFNQDELFSEPVEIFSNIENGLGVFGGYSIGEVELRF